MRTLPFDSVTVATSEIGRFRNVVSVDQAADFLAHSWPPKRGPSYFAARVACLDALEYAASADDVRDAFIKAAKESEIYIGERIWREF
jgi:hypothetical protein